MSGNNDFDVVSNKVQAILKIAPRMTHELAEMCGFKSADTFRRNYLTKMMEQNLIEKVEGSSRWKLRGQKSSQNKMAEALTTDESFYNTEVIKAWRSRNTAKRREIFISSFKNICMGTMQRLPPKKMPKGERDRILGLKINFKINPDSWSHPYDTERCIAALKEFYESDELGHGTRAVLRQALQYGMKIILTEAESEALGISGKTDKPDLSRLHMKKDVYNAILQDPEIDTYHKSLFFFSYTTFFRPSTRYIVKIDDIEFYDREVKYIQLED